MRNTSTRRMVVGGLLVCGLLGGAQAQLFYTNSGGYWAAAAGSSTNSWTNQAGAATALANFSNIVFNTAGINTNNMATGGSYGWVTWTVANVTNAVSSGANSYYFTGFTNSGGGTVYFASKVTFSNQSIAPIIYNNGQLTFTNVMTNLNTSSAITFESSVGATTTVSGVMGSNNMGVVKNGLGTLYLNAANTYRGNTTNNDGTLKLGNNAALGTGTLVINGGKLDVNGARTNTNAQIWNGDWEFVGSSTLISTGAVTLGGNRIVTVTASTLTEGGVIGEGGIGYSLTKAGAGTLVLTNANTYSGGTIISNGTLVANNNNALGGGLLTMSGGVLSNSVNSSLTNAINLSVASTIGVLSANTLTLSGVITNSGGLTKAGAGTLILAGVNTYSGGTFLNVGTLNVTNDTALGLGGSGLTFNGGTLQSSGNMTLNNRTVTLTGAGTFTADASTTVTINNAISGAGALTKAGVGTLILSGTNSYTGITTVNGGILTFDSMSSNSIKRLNVAGGAVGAQVNIYGPTTLGTAYVGNASTDLRSVLLITNKLTATRLYVGNTAGSAGAVYQTGGLAALTYVLLGYANSATYGFYQLAGGSLTAGNWEQAAGSGGLGLFYITGGTNTTSSGEGILTANGNGTGVVYITGGVVNGAGQLVNGYSSTGRGEITIAGNANVLLNNAVQLNQAGTTTNFLNLNGGVLQSTKIYKNVAGGLSVVNFNGGTWCLSAGGTVLGDGSFGTTGAVDAAYIYGGGAIIDTTTNNVTITQPLLAPGGSGVVINASSLSLSNYIGAPYVAISSGGGTGATAIAQFDYNSGSVTGIVVTSPGLGYTSTPTVTLIGGGNTNYDLTGVTVLGANTGGGLTKLGNGMLTLSGANTYSGGTIISTGILSIVTTSALPGWDSNGGYAVSSNAALAVGNAVTDDNITTILATTNFAAGAGLAFDTAAGDRSYAAIIGDTVNGALGVVKVGTNALTLSGANTYGSGTIINGGLLNINADAALGAIPGAAVTNITFSGSSTLQFANTFDLATNRNVLINSGVTATFDVQGYTNAIPGLISGAGNLTKTGTGTLVLSGANTYSGTNQIRGGTVQLGANNALSTNALIFGDTTGNTGNLNLGAFDQSIGALTVNSASSNVNTITISTGHTLTIGGNVVIGPTTPPATSPSLLTMTGGGALNVSTATGGLFQVGGSTSVGDYSVLDLTGLSSVTINVSSTGTVRVNNPQSVNTPGVQATLLLPTPSVSDSAPVTTITAGRFNVGDNGAFNNVSTQINAVVLGTGLTTINATNVNIGTGNRDIGSLTFAGSGGNITIRAPDGVSRCAAFNVASGGGSTGTTAPGANDLVDFTGHYADLLLSALNIGNQSRYANLTVDFKFDTGILDVTGVTIGFHTGAAASTAILSNNLNIGGGTVIIGANGVDMGGVTNTSTTANTTYGNFSISGGTVTIGSNATWGGSIRLGNNISASGLAAADDALNITGGSVTLAGDIVKGTLTRTTSTILLNGGTLDMAGNRIGSAALPIDVLNFQAGILRNIAEINGGTTPLVKTGSGTLLLDTTNAYTGGTIISNGTLIVNNPTNSGFATGTGNVNIFSGGTLQGTGTVASVINSGGTVVPGSTNSIGTLTMNNLTMNPGGSFNFDFNFGNPQTNDWLLVLGNVTINGGTFNFFEESTGAEFTTNGTYNLIQFGGGVSGLFSSINYGGSKKYVLDTNGVWLTVTIEDATYIWNGSNSLVDSYWSSTNNWVTRPPDAGNVPLKFDGVLGLINTNDFAANTKFSGITFLADAGAFVLEGANAVNLTKDVENYSLNLQTINMPLVFDGGNRAFNAYSNSLVINGVISETNGAWALLKNGDNSLTLTAPNTYSGGTVINAGTLVVSNASALGSGPVAITNGLLQLAQALSIGGNLSGSGATVDLGAYTLTINQGGNSTFAGAITNTGALVKNGAGTLTLIGANTYTGGTLISAGTLQLGDGSALNGLMAGDITNNAALIFANPNAQDFGGLISGSGTVTKNAAGLLTLGGASTYSGLTAVNGGTLVLVGSLSNSSISVASGATFSQSVSSVIAGVSAALTNSGTTILSGANTYGGSTVIKAGSLQLQGGDNRLPVTTTISFTGPSTLDVQGNNQTVASVTFSGVTMTNIITGAAGSLSVTGAVDFSVGPTSTATMNTLDMSGLGTFTYNAPANAFRVGATGSGYSGGRGSATLAGTNTITAAQFLVGEVTLTAPSANTNIVHLGQVNTINADDIQIGGSRAQNALFDFRSGLVAPTLTLRGTAGGNSYVTNMLVGMVDNNSYTAESHIFDVSAGTLDALIGTLSVGRVTNRQGVINDSFRMGAGTLTATNINLGQNWPINTTYTNAASGTFSLNGGTVKVMTLTLADNPSNNVVGYAYGAFILSNSSSLLQAQTIQKGRSVGLSTAVVTWVAGTITNYDASTGLTISNVYVNLVPGADHVLGVGDGRTATSYATLTNTGNLVKSGNGALILSSNSTYSGTTIINGGVVQLNSTLAAQNSTVSNLVAGGLQFGGATNAYTIGGLADTLDLVLTNVSGSGVTLSIGNNGNTSVYSHVLSDAGLTGAVNKVGAGNLTLTGPSTYSGGSTVTGGKLLIGNADALGTGPITLSGGALASDGATPRLITNAVSVTTLSTLGDTVNTGLLTVSGMVNFTGAARGLTINSAVTLNGGSTNGALNKYGPGTLLIQGVNTWTADGEFRLGTVVLDGSLTNSGTIRANGDVATASNATVRFIITTNGSFVTTGTGSNLRNGDSVTGSNRTTTNVMDLAGFVSIPNANASSGNWYLGGKDSYIGVGYVRTGAVVIIRSAQRDGATGYGELNLDGGTLRAMASDPGFISNLNAANILDGGALIDSAGYNITITQPLLGGGGLTKLGAGVLTLATNNTYTGNTTISGGTLQIGAGGTSGAVLGTITNNGTLAFNHSDNLTDPNSIVGTGGLLQNGSGVLTLNNAYTFSGVTLSNGTLSVSSDDNLGGGSSAVNLNGGTLQIAGTTLNNLNTHTVNWSNLRSVLDIASVGNIFTVTNDITAPASLTKRGVGTLVLTGNNSFTGVVISAGTMVLTGTNTTTATVTVGSATPGILQINGGVLNLGNNHLQTGNALGNLGAIYMTGGMVSNINQFLIGGGGNTANYGFLNLSGGTLIQSSSGGRIRVGQYGSLGLWYQTNGTFSGNYSFDIANANGVNTGVVYLAGAAVVSNAVGVVVGGANAGSLGILTVAENANATFSGALTIGGGATTNGIVNLNGGTTRVNAVVINAAGVMNFNGGTLRAGAASTPVTGTGAAFIYANGATLDTYTNTMTINPNLLAPTGSGVTNIPVLTGGSGYIGAPYVAINGDGGGVTAIANMTDDGTGNGTFKIASLTITSPGTNYTAVTSVNLYGGGGSGATFDTGSAAFAINTSGGLTKVGAGTLILVGVNTFTGGSIISNGTLQVGAGSGTAGSIIGNVNIVDPAARLAFALGGVNYTNSGVISGAGSLYAAVGTSSSGYLSLTNLNSYQGGTMIGGGEVRVKDGNAFGTGAITITNNALLNLAANDIQVTNTLTLNNGVLKNMNGSSGVNYSGPITLATGSTNMMAAAENSGFLVSGLISGSGVLIKTNSYGLILTAANNFTGDTLIQGGQIIVSNTLALQSSTVNCLNGNVTFGSGITSVTLGGLAGGSNITLQTQASEAVALSVGNNQANTTYSGGLDGSGSLIKIGNGTLTLSGTNIFTGGVTLQSGVLIFGNALAMPSTGPKLLIPSGMTVGASYGLDQTLLNSISNASAGTIALAGNTSSNLDFTGLSSVSLGAINGTWTNSGSITTADGVTYRLGGGGGTLVINTTNLLTGSRSVLAFASGSGGTINLRAPQDFSGGITILGGGTLNFTATNQLGTVSAFNPTNIILNGGTLMLDSSAGATYFGNRGVALDTAGGTLASGNSQLQLYTVISDLVPGTGGSLNIVTSGGGIVILYSNNTYSGGTILQAGAQLMFNATATASNFLGTGLFTLNGGQLRPISSSAAVTITNAVLFAADTTIQSGGGGSLTFSGPMTLSTNRTITQSEATYAATISGAIGDGGNNYALTKAGVGTLVLSGSNTYTGPTIVSAGTVNVQSNQSAANGGWIITNSTSDNITVNFLAGSIIAVGSGKSLDLRASAGSPPLIKLNAYGTVSNNGTLTVRRRGVLALGSGANWTQGGDLSVGLDEDTGYDSIMTVSNGATFTYTGANSIKVNPTPSTSKGGSATLTIAGTFVTGQGFERTVTNSLGTATVTLNGGLLQLSAPVADLTVLNQPLVFSLAAGGGTIDTAGNNGTISGAISGTGALTKLGAGTLTLVGANTYSGGTIISNGTLAVGASNVLGTAALVMSGGTLGVANGGGWTETNNINLLAANNTVDTTGGALTLSGTLTNSGALTKLGAGTLTLAAANTYSGATVISNGTLKIANTVGSLSSSTAVYVDNLGIIDFSGNIQTIAGLTGGGVVTNDGGNLTLNLVNATNTFGGTLNGASTLTLTGGGSLIMTDTNNFGIATFVNDAAYVVNGLHNGGVITVNSNGFVGGVGTIATTLNVLSNGFYSPGATLGLGTQTVANLTLNPGGLLAVGLTTASNGLARVSTSFAMTNALLRLDLTQYDAAASVSLQQQFTVLTYNTSSVFNSADTNQCFLLQDWGTAAQLSIVLTNNMTFAVGGGLSTTNFFMINYDAVANGQGLITLTAVPEPGTASLLGLIGVAFLVRRIRRRM